MRASDGSSMRVCAALLSMLTACAGKVVVHDADAGPVDAGHVLDAGPVDAGAVDAGAVDAGSPVDAGECVPSASMRFPPFPANPVVADPEPFACDPDAGAANDIDAVIAQMAPGSWRELPCTQMAHVCPLPYNHYTCNAVMTAWSGGAYDTTRDRLVVFGGGHNDSHYNNIFTFDLASASWARVTELPDGLTGDSVAPAFRDIRVESCGYYPRTPDLCIPSGWLTPSGYVDHSRCDDPALTAQLDLQQPRSVHSYGSVAYSPIDGRFYVLGSVALFPSGQTGTAHVLAFDFASRTWSRAADNPNPGFATSATDGDGNLWFVSSATFQLVKYDVRANAWSAEASAATQDYYRGAAVDTQRNHLVISTDGAALQVYDLGVPGAPLTQVTATGPVTLPQAPGLAYDPDLDRFVAWNGGRSVSFLDPTTWAWTTVAATGDDPGTPTQNGTYGRFRFSPSRKVFVSVSSTETNVFLYKPPAAAP
jgi:hypothetical protein